MTIEKRPRLLMIAKKKRKNNVYWPKLALYTAFSQIVHKIDPLTSQKAWGNDLL